jgi:hypothetical protein
MVDRSEALIDRLLPPPSKPGKAAEKKSEEKEGLERGV